MSRFTIQAGVASQIPSLIQQITRLKSASDATVQSMTASGSRSIAMATRNQGIMEGNYKRTITSIGEVSREFDRASASIMGKAQSMRMVANQAISQGVAGSGASAASLRDSARLAGPGMQQFANAQKNINDAISGMSTIDRLTEMAAQRAQASLIFNREYIGLQQEQGNILRKHQAISFATVEVARQMRAERTAELQLTKEISAIAAKDPRFRSATIGTSNLEGQRQLQLELMGLEDASAQKQLEKSTSITKFVQSMAKSVGLSEQEYRIALLRLKVLDDQIVRQERVKAQAIERATVMRAIQSEHTYINQRLAEGIAEYQMMQQATLGLEDALKVMGNQWGDINAKSQIQVTLLREIGQMKTDVFKATELEAKNAQEMIGVYGIIEKQLRDMGNTMGQNNSQSKIQVSLYREMSAEMIRQQNARNAQIQSFARQSFQTGLGYMPRDPGSIALEKQALGLMQNQVQVKTADGIITRKLSEEEARLVVARRAGTDALKLYNTEYQVANGLMRRGRAHMINNSIGMFVLSITITQTVAAMEQITKSIADANPELELFGIHAEDAALFLNEFGQAIRFAIGPIQVYTSVTMLMSMANRQFFLSTIPVMGILGTMTLMIKAFTAKSKGMRIVFGGIATTVGAISTAMAYYNFQLERATLASNRLAVAKGNLAVVTSAETAVETANNITKETGIVVSKGFTSATIAETNATGNVVAAKTAEFSARAAVMTLKTWGMGAIFVASAIATAISAFATLKALSSFETRPGEFKEVGNTGPALVHKGEMIGTPAKIGDKGTGFGSSGPQVIINNYVAGNLDSSVPKTMAKRYRSGQIGGIGF